MKRIVVLSVALLSTACGSSLRRCNVDTDCVGGARCAADTGLCIFVDDGGAGGSGGGGTNSCDPPCPGSSECTGTVCAARYSGLSISAPPKVGPRAFTIAADLVLAPQRTRADPPTLSVSVAGNVLFDDAGQQIMELRRTDAGHYETSASLPLAEATWTLQVSFPDAGLTAFRDIALDLSSPRAEVRLSALPARLIDTGFTAASPDAPGAYRRDETVTVFLDSQDSDAVSAGFDLVTDGGPVQRFPTVDAGCVSRFDGGRCFAQAVDLWRHPMLAFRQGATISARVTDDVGQASELDAGALTITRFKWQRTVPGLLSSLAIAPGGHVVTHVTPPSPATVGVLSSWTPAGAVRWSQPSDGFNGHVMVGSLGADPYVYVTEVDLAQQLRVSAFPSAAPGSAPLVNRIPNVGSVNAVGAPLLLPRTEEIVYVPTRHTSTVGMYAWSSGTMTTAGLDAGPLNGAELLNATTDNRRIHLPIFRVSDPTNAIVLRFDFPFAAGLPPTRDQSLAFGGAGATANIPTQENTFTRAVTDGGRPSSIYGGPALPLSGAALIAGDTAFYANELFAPAAGVPTLCRVPFGGMATATCADLRSYGSPIIGARNLLYVAAMENVVTQMGFQIAAVDAVTLTRQWETPVLANSYVVRPLNLDCSRDSAGAPLAGRPGVLYASTLLLSSPASTALIAVIVDSPGFDQNAAWPMEKHDPRNTNNLATSLAAFSCP